MKHTEVGIFYKRKLLFYRHVQEKVKIEIKISQNHTSRSASVADLPLNTLLTVSAKGAALKNDKETHGALDIRTIEVYRRSDFNIPLISSACGMDSHEHMQWCLSAAHSPFANDPGNSHSATIL